MTELRLSLLALGVLFIAGLVAWEWWRRRQAAVQARREAEIVRSTALAAVDDDSSRHVVNSEIEVSPLTVATRDPLLGALPIVEMGQQLDAQLKPNVDRYGLVDADTVVLDPAEIEAGSALRVEWPDEAQRQIIGLRIVARPGTRFAGLRVRQALVGDGYVYGDYRIFHRPGADGRAIVSAASLTKPGYFEFGRMDTQTFAGISLFVVLPGALPGPQAFETMLGSARGLAQRLGGELFDATGGPLSDERAQELRAALRDSGPLARAAGAD